MAAARALDPDVVKDFAAVIANLCAWFGEKRHDALPGIGLPCDTALLESGGASWFGSELGAPRC
jgi:hypothetical protein